MEEPRDDDCKEPSARRRRLCKGGPLGRPWTSAATAAAQTGLPQRPVEHGGRIGTILTMTNSEGRAGPVKPWDTAPRLEPTTEEVGDCPISLDRALGEVQTCPCEPQPLFRRLWR